MAELSSALDVPGRVHSGRVGSRTGTPLNVILFGGCRLEQPLTTAPGIRERVSLQRYPGVMQIHSFGEMFQIIQVLRGEKDVPAQYRFLCRMPARLGPIARAADFTDIDVALLETSCPVEVIFRGCYVNRNAISYHLAMPIRAVGKEAKTCVARWFRLGLMEANEEIRAKTAAELIQYVPDNIEMGAELARQFILEARSERANITDGFQRMRTLLGRPIGVVTYTWYYLDDGRGVDWPDGFKHEVTLAARTLGLPVFDPSPLIRDCGVPAALLEDRAHYTQAFLPTIADALVAFAHSVRAQPRCNLEEMG